MQRSHFVHFTATACASGLLASTALAQNAPVRIEGLPVDSAAEPYYANDMGFFKEAGLSIDLQTGAPNGAAISAAVAAGALEAGVSNLVSIAQAHAKGIPFVVIGPGGLYTSKAPSTLLIVPNGSTIRSSGDLTGKTIGVDILGGLSHYGLQAWLDKHGSDSRGVRYTEIPQLEMAIALHGGRIDAGVFVEPFATAARRDGRVLGAPFDAIASSFLITVLFSTRAWAEANRNTVRRLQDALARTADWANKNHADSGAILMKYSHLRPETLNTMPRTLFANRLDRTLLQPVIDLCAKYGNVPAFSATDILI